MRLGRSQACRRQPQLLQKADLDRTLSWEIGGTRQTDQHGTLKKSPRLHLLAERVWRVAASEKLGNSSHEHPERTECKLAERTTHHLPRCGDATFSYVQFPSGLERESCRADFQGWHPPQFRTVDDVHAVHDVDDIHDVDVHELVHDSWTSSPMCDANL